MVTNLDASLSPFLIKRNERGRIIRLRATSDGGGIIDGTVQQTNQGLSYLVASGSIVITSQSNGQIVIFSAGGGGGSTYTFFGAGSTTVSSVGNAITITTPSIPDASASYIVIGTTSSLSNERQLSASNGLILTDNGANSTVALSVNDSIVATLSGSVFKGDVGTATAMYANLGFSGSLTRLTDGRSYITHGQGAKVTSSSNAQVTIASHLQLIPSPRTTSGTIETQVGSFYVPGGTYTSLRAMLGSSGINDASYLLIRNFAGGGLIAALTSSVTGSPTETTYGASLTFPTIGYYDVFLKTTSASGSAICNGFQLIP